MIVHRPIEASLYDGRILDDGMDDFISVVRFAGIIAAGRERAKPLTVKYTTKGIGGYK
jgi:hypothetical protein